MIVWAKAETEKSKVARVKKIDLIYIDFLVKL